MTTEAYAESVLAQMLKIAAVQFGSAIKGFWFYDREACPGCQEAVTALKHRGEEAVSLNAFIYRQTGVLIGYFLCSRCARQVLQAAQKNSNLTTPLHGKIEENLIAAYRRHVRSLAA